MEETVTTEPSISFMTSGFVDYGGGTEYNCPRLPVSLMIFAGVCMGICVCGLVGNGIVMWFLGFHMKQNPFTIYILNLAVADFSLLLIFFLLLSTILILIAFCLYNLISFYLDFVLIVEFLCHFFDLSSLGLLAAISVERCISVLFPIWYRCHRPKRLSGVTCGVLWALAGVFVSSMYFGINFAESSETVFAGVDFAISVTLLLIISISDLSLFIKLRCGSQRRHPDKLWVAVLLNVIFFFFALSVHLSVVFFLNIPNLHEFFPEITYFLLALLNSSINPVTYFLVGSWRRHRFQCSVKVAFRQLFEEKATSEEGNPEEGNPVPGAAVVETTV